MDCQPWPQHQGKIGEPTECVHILVGHAHNTSRVPTSLENSHRFGLGTLQCLLPRGPWGSILKVLTRKRLCNSKKDLCTQPFFRWSYPAGAAKTNKSWQGVSSLSAALNALPVWLWRLTLVKLMISARQMALVNRGLIRAHWMWDFSSWCLKMEREWTFGPSSDDGISGPLLPLFLLSILSCVVSGACFSSFLHVRMKFIFGYFWWVLICYWFEVFL